MLSFEELLCSIKLSLLIEKMVYIITGAKDRGKTERIRSLYDEKKGDGFISAKRFNGGTFTGYDIIRLSSGETMALAVRGNDLPAEWDELDTVGSFSISGKAIRFAESVIDDIIMKGIEPVYIDEIGTLEIKGKGFNTLLEKVLATKREIFMAVRKNCVEDVIALFAIENCRVSDVDD